MPLVVTRYPPPHGPLLLPVRSPRTAAAAVALEAGCRPAALLARRAACAWIALGGERLVPPRRLRWSPPMEDEAWVTLLARWCEAVGPFDAIAVWERRQAGRRGVGVLLGGVRGPIAFVKLRPAPAPGLHTEARVLRGAADDPAPRPFHLPAVLGAGGDGAWSWIALSVIPPFHRVPRHPRLERVAAGVARVLHGLPRPAAAPPHWAPMHGDLTPWNLREDRTGRLWLYDWERAAWAPPGADLVLYHAAAAAVRGESRSRASAAVARWPEAAGFWARRFRARPAPGPGERRLQAALLAVLGDGGVAAGAREMDDGLEEDHPSPRDVGGAG